MNALGDCITHGTDHQLLTLNNQSFQSLCIYNYIDAEMEPAEAIEFVPCDKTLYRPPANGRMPAD